MDQFPSREKLMAAIANGTTDEMAGDLSIMGPAGILLRMEKSHLELGERPNKSNRGKWHCCKEAMRAAFVLFKGLTFQKSCLLCAFLPVITIIKCWRSGFAVQVTHHLNTL